MANLLIAHLPIWSGYFLAFALPKRRWPMQAALYERIVHDKYCFTGFHLCLCWCQLEILKLKDGRTAVIATELKDNPGTSITNAMEILAATVCLDFGIDVYKLVWIEHCRYAGGNAIVPPHIVAE